uniref:C-type lectin domain-containing protein n=1 Tax=Fundulus heteroclitus TaxID=8078 RepID=A0A3Q2PW35_FUNHE
MRDYVNEQPQHTGKKLSGKTKYNDPLSFKRNGCASSQCPADWRELNSRCYFLSTETQTWEGSRKHCQSQGAELVVINSEQEQYLLFWIGLHGKNGMFQWVDGSALETPFWQRRQPDHGGPNNNEDCVEMYHKEPVLLSWNDAPCGHQRHWLCEKDLGFFP